MSYWVLFIGIAVVSWLVQMNLQSKFYLIRAVARIS